MREKRAPIRRAKRTMRRRIVVSVGFAMFVGALGYSETVIKRLLNVGWADRCDVVMLCADLR